MSGGLRGIEMLAGVWELARTIEHADGTHHVLTGRATFTSDGDGWVQHEIGVLSGPQGQPALTASRRYLWREAPGHLEVLFEDGRPFHIIPLGEARPEAGHDCPPDTYEVAYDFRDPSAWRARWRVSGPRKDYLMESLYRRPAG